MKINLEIVRPAIIEPEDLDSGIHMLISKNGDGATEVGSDKVYSYFGPLGYYMDTSAMSIDFKKILFDAGIDIKEYYGIGDYELNKIGAKFLSKDLDNYPWVTKIVEGSLDDLDEEIKIGAFEFASKTDGADKMCVVINPQLRPIEMSFLVCIKKYMIAIDIPSEKAVEYLTSGDSLYTLKKQELRELLESLHPAGISPALDIFIEEFKDGQDIAAWDLTSVEGRNSDIDWDNAPWRRKIADMKEKAKEIMEDKRLCPVVKYKKLKKLL